MRRGATVLLVIGITALAVNLRAAITSLPPVFPELSARLGLSPAAVTVLATLPVLCFGLFSGVAAPLSRRFGEERVLLASLGLVAAGLVLRGALPGALLYPGTVIASGAIALMNVLLPSLVKRRQPGRAGLLIGVYLLSLAGGAVFGSLLAVPAFRDTAHAGWLGGPVRFSLWLWAVPAAVAFAVWLPQSRYRPAGGPGGLGVPAGPGGPGIPGVPGDLDIPDVPGDPDIPNISGGPNIPNIPETPSIPGISGGPNIPGISEGPSVPGVPEGTQAAQPGGRVAVARHALAWQVTAFMGLQSLSYYGTLSWLPTLLRDRGASAAQAGDLLALMNLGNAVTCLLVPVLAHRMTAQRLLVVPTVLATAAGIAGALYAPLGGTWAWILLLGLGQGSSLGLGIFFTMARAPNPVAAASLSALAQGWGYLLATAGPLAVGLLHASTGGWDVPVGMLLALCTAQLGAGWLAGRARLLPLA